MKRRQFLASGAVFAGFLLALPGNLFAEWVARNFQQVPLKDAFMNALGTDEIALTDKILISVPPVATDGAAVHVEITSEMKGERLYLFVEKNPAPLVFTCTFHGSALPWFSLNIRMKESSQVHAVLWDGLRYHRTSVHVDVLSQAC